MAKEEEQNLVEDSPENDTGLSLSEPLQQISMASGDI